MGCGSGAGSFGFARNPLVRADVGAGIYLAYEMVSRLFKKEGYPENWADKLFVYCIVSSVIGARLGHCLFYEWDYYGAHPAEILKIWKGGLASHGGVFALILALIWYSKTVTKKVCGGCSTV